MDGGRTGSSSRSALRTQCSSSSPESSSSSSSSSSSCSFPPTSAPMIERHYRRRRVLCAVARAHSAQQHTLVSCGEKREAELRFSLLAVPATATPLCSVGYSACTLLALPFVVSLFFLVGCFILKSDFLSPESRASLSTAQTADSSGAVDSPAPCCSLFVLKAGSRDRGRGRILRSRFHFSIFEMSTATAKRQSTGRRCSIE